MGQSLCRLAVSEDKLQLLAGLVSPDKVNASADVPLYATLRDIPEATDATVLIDFTTPESTMQRLQEASELKVPVVIGTTGFSPEELESINQFARQIPILLSANMSLGVNVLASVVENLSARLAKYDIEIIETHHRLKKDSPSGTAILLGNAAAKGRDIELQQVSRHGREGLTGERPAGEIGFHAVRGGDVIGDHTVLFAGIGERVEVTHKASSRDTFAAGALFAARYLAHQPPGLYSMKDALGIR